MCRNIVDGGRRCPCTSGPYRSAARYARLGREAAQGQGVGPADGNVAVLDRPTFDIERINDVTARIRLALDPHVPDHMSGSEWRENRFALVEEFGSLEQASTWVGTQIRDEAERRSGVDPAAVADALAQRVKDARYEYAVARSAYEKADNHYQAVRRDALRDPDRDAARDPELEAAFAAKEQARLAVNDAANAQGSIATRGQDDESREAMTRLADAYREVLAEVRPMGGELGWHEKTDKAAKELFNTAAENYPSDWIEKAGVGPQPIGKISKARAHYIRSKFAETRRRVPATRGALISGGTAEDINREIDAELLDNQFLGITAEERARIVKDGMENPGEKVYARFTHYEAHMVYGSEPDREVPRGRGWERYDRDYGEHRRTFWRRPRMKMETVSGVSAPEITSDRDPVHVNDKPGGYATATHELAHRMEHKVPGIAQLESEFLARRAAGESLTRIYKGGRNAEMGYADDLPLHYAGKVYPGTGGDRDGGQHYELLSCATQGMFGGDHGGLIGLHGDGTQYSRDDDYRSWALGVLATV